MDVDAGVARTRGRVLTPDDLAATREALRAAGGSIAGAAKILGLHRCTVQARLRSHPEAWPDGVRRLTPVDGGRPVALSPEELTATREALRATGGNLEAAGRLLGLTGQGVKVRLRLHPEAWPEGVPRRTGKHRAETPTGKAF